MPYFSLIAPRGWKSASSEYLIPIFSAYALCDHTLSTLTPSTSASSVSKFFMSFTKQACSFVQVGLQSSGYHTSTTFFFPAKSDSFTSFFSWFSNVKSGAVCPTEMLMIFPPVVLKFVRTSYRNDAPPPTNRLLSCRCALSDRLRFFGHPHRMPSE